MRAIAIFTIGAMVGTTFGFLLAALCRVAARTDRPIAREEREEVERMRLGVVSDAGVGLQPSQENHADGVRASGIARAADVSSTVVRKFEHDHLH
jgi:hypothetical protein